MVRTFTFRAACLLAAVALPLVSVADAQQSDVSVSPFVSFLPSTGASPLAGLALTLAGNGGLALRASGHLSLETTNDGSVGSSINYTSIRPWGADADAVLFLGGRYLGGYERTLSPYVFAGIGVAARDSLGTRLTRNNWSYGAGLTVPLGSAVDIFGESRWRMSRYVLPTARFAPTPTNELRFGLSFHVGVNGSRNRSASRRSSRRAELPSGESVARYPASTTVSRSAARVLGTADRYLGTPHVYGGSTPDGFDCSGFTQYVFAEHGVRLPRTAREQAQVGMSVPAEWRAIAPGDLVMFADGGPISHVAIYAGHNRIIHSSSSGGGVRYDDLSTNRGDWFVDHMVAARRVTTDPRGLMIDLSKNFADVGVKLDAPDRAPRP